MATDAMSPSGGMITTSAGLGDGGGDGVPYEDPFANNPFQLPTEKEVFQMTKEAKQKKLEERERQRQPATFETIETMTENFSETCRSAGKAARS